jgi:hypothetical protein
MTVLAAEKQRDVRGLTQLGKAVAASSTTFWKGALLGFNTSGLLVNAADTAGFRIAGVCNKTQTTPAGNTGYVEFEFGHEEFVAGAAATAADIGAMVMVADNGAYTDATTATNDVKIGLLMELATVRSVAGGWIRIGVFGPDSA